MYKKVSVKILQVRTVLSILEIFDAYIYSIFYRVLFFDVYDSSNIPKSGFKPLFKYEKRLDNEYQTYASLMVPGTGIEPV